MLTLAALYWFAVRRWFGRWGTTPEERTRVMPGDAVIIVWPVHLDNDRTRLVSRGTQRFAKRIRWWLFMRVMEPAAFIMTRRMLLGLKQRAEGLRARRVSETSDNHRAAA